ncbi:putative fungal specific transcription factor domain-containing protein [Rosellinia necatrix]|uniref:Putative fungal specific transcription factor domain-containing protein n=1 Tax=Rosellinia necatrix TaxID=77044 RepID=A0A1S7UIG5_ROSNE|nr:putative fungal specific transcription factor domain-containing protein [Rosellinia necatrix]
MDASIVFRQVEGFGSRIPRPHQDFSPARTVHDDDHGEPGPSHRIAHTLTACCRCRQRKTRCDPTLPRCLPCERSGSACEYFDTTKGKKISRYYVVKLQEMVRGLEAELGQYIDDDDDIYAKDHEDFIRPGGLVRLNETDETPRYLGPSSGIAMTRIVMEEAKRYTDSGRISELIPDVKGRRKATGSVTPATANRSQSFSMPAANPRKKSYPMVSAVPATDLPSRAIADRLIEVFHQRAQVFTPALHERVLANALEDAYAGSQDPYQNFVVRLVMAISMQKLDSNYAGLADSYYLAAMQYFEAVVRPKDLRTLQCLVLIGQYSLLTPTRTAVYYVVGLATRISQQLGLADEKTIDLDCNDPLTLDMRRRLGWIVSTFELGLSQSMGRPNGFAKTDDIIDIKWFETVADSNITENGIIPGPPDEKKLVAIHFCKMRLLQAEIRRTLYEMKRPEPRTAQHPWFASMEAKMERWRLSSPEKPPWCKPWFTGRYHTMMVTLHRPSPQVPRPSVQSAAKCFNSAAFVIDISSKQMMSAAVDITWVFLLTLYMSLNTLLWSVTRYPDVRAAHSREEVQELVNVALDIIDQCVERWPGTASASELYTILTKACLQSYDSNGTPAQSSPGSFNTPPSQAETNSPNALELSTGMATSQPGGVPGFHPPHFGHVFGSGPEATDSYSLDNPFPSHPTFRSNSIFLNPASNDHTGRRFSYFPPDFTQPDGIMSGIDPSPPPSEAATISPPFLSSPPPAQSPAESMSSLQASTSAMSTPLLSTPLLATTALQQGSPDGMLANGLPPTQPQHRPPLPAFTIPPLPPGQLPQGQRPLPQATTVTDWFNPPPPFISPYSFGGGMGTGFWGGNGPNGINGGFDGLEVGGPGGGGGFDARGLPPERQGSLSQAQQMELMSVLENEGMADIDTYLSTGGGGIIGYGGGGAGVGGGGNGVLGAGDPGMGMDWGVTGPSGGGGGGRGA